MPHIVADYSHRAHFQFLHLLIIPWPNSNFYNHLLQIVYQQLTQGNRKQGLERTTSMCTSMNTKRVYTRFLRCRLSDPLPQGGLRKRARTLQTWLLQTCSFARVEGPRISLETLIFTRPIARKKCGSGISIRYVHLRPPNSLGTCRIRHYQLGSLATYSMLSDGLTTMCDSIRRFAALLQF